MIAKKGKFGVYLECASCGSRRPYNSPDGASKEGEKLEGKCPDCGGAITVTDVRFKP